ncbi:MAG: hypothetical protein AAGL98_06785, partial [Planctomycetota bacterium]
MVVSKGSAAAAIGYRDTRARLSAPQDLAVHPKFTVLGVAPPRLTAATRRSRKSGRSVVLPLDRYRLATFSRVRYAVRLSSPREAQSLVIPKPD